MRICTPLAPFYTIYGSLNKANGLADKPIIRDYGNNCKINGKALITSRAEAIA